MQAPERSHAIQSSTPPLTLVPARPDFLSVKTQFIVGAVLMVLAAATAYAGTLAVGFLLDDFLHVSYAASAAAGDWAPFLSNLTGNWGGSDLMVSYRPLTSVSILIDYLLWGTNAAGFHLTNILLLAACAVMTGLITLEITGLRGNRLGASAAVWAGLLFAAHPLHPEAAAWIIGRVDLLSTLFYLSSLFCYMRYRLLRESAYLFLSLASFACALLCKEMAVTLPVVVAAAEILLFRHGDDHLPAELRRRRGAQRLMNVGLFFAVLGFIATIRFGLLGTVVGGYLTGSNSLISTLGNLINKPTLLKILYPANEELSFAAFTLPIVTGAYLVLFASLLARAAMRTISPAPYLFLLFCVAVAAVPAAQVWHIYPNLVGSRLFFLPSAPFCILVALAALPALDTLSRRSLPPAVMVGTLAMSALFASWAYLLHGNLNTWYEAGQRMQSFKQQVDRLIATLPQEGKLLLADLPTDHKGAGMLTREQYLKILLRPPFAQEDFSGRILTIEPVIAGSRDLMWPQQFANALKQPGVLAYRWLAESSVFEPIGEGEGVERIEFEAGAGSFPQLTVAPVEAVVPALETWAVPPDKSSQVMPFEQLVRVYAGRAPVTIYLPPVKINTRQSGLVRLKMDLLSTTGCKGCHADKTRLIWDAQMPDGSTVSGQAPLFRVDSKTYMCWPGRFRNWTLARSIKRIGLSFASGDYYADWRSLQVMPDRYAIPQLNLIDTSSQTRTVPWPGAMEIDPAAPPLLSYDASGISGASRVRVVFTQSGTTFDPPGLAHLYSYDPPSGSSLYLAEIEQRSNSGTVQIPDVVLRSPGLHQIRATAYNEAGFAIGAGSEPVTILVPMQER